MSGFCCCPECGRNLAIWRPFFEASKKALNREFASTQNVLVSKFSFAAQDMPDCKIIFDTLKINNMCCRMHLATTFNINIKL